MCSVKTNDGINKDVYPRYFDVPAMNTTFLAKDKDEAEQAIQMGAKEVPEFAYEKIKAAYAAGHASKLRQVNNLYKDALSDPDYEYNLDVVEKLRKTGHRIEQVMSSDSVIEYSPRNSLIDYCSRSDVFRAHKTDKAVMVTPEGKPRIFVGDKVIFKQKTARHLAVMSDLAWEYEHGTITYLNSEKGMTDVMWLQGYQCRHDDVPLEDIFTVLDENGEYIRDPLCPIHGQCTVIMPFVKEGSEESVMEQS